MKANDAVSAGMLRELEGLTDGVDRLTQRAESYLEGLKKAAAANALAEYIVLHNDGAEWESDRDGLAISIRAFRHALQKSALAREEAHRRFL